MRLRLPRAGGGTCQLSIGNGAFHGLPLARSEVALRVEGGDAVLGPADAERLMAWLEATAARRRS